MATIKRTDVHRPGAIQPDDYQFVAMGYMKCQGLEDVLAIEHNRKLLHEHQERTGGKFANHEHGGSCQCCGAHCLYNVIFHHAETNEYIRVGTICAEKLDMGDPRLFRTFRKHVADARKRKAGKAKAKLILEENWMEDAWALYEMDVEQLKDMRLVSPLPERPCEYCRGTGQRMHCDNQNQPTGPIDCSCGGKPIIVWANVEPYRILVDIVGRLVRHGDLSERQMDFLEKLMRRCMGYRAAAEDREKQEAEARANATPCPEGRMEVTGVLASTKYNEHWGYWQMLVIDDRGFKVWGTLPRALSPDDRGSRVRFTATVTRSDKDPLFGFYKRPAKVAKLEDNDNTTN